MYILVSSKLLFFLIFQRRFKDPSGFPYSLLRLAYSSASDSETKKLRWFYDETAVEKLQNSEGDDD